MSIETLSLDLFKANAELQLRLTRLLQESGQQWLDAVQRSSTDDIAETTAEIEGVLRADTWQSLATLPAESFWRAFQDRASDVQQVNKIAVQNQTAFTTGLQQALQTWQASVGKAVDQTVAGAGKSDPLQDMLKQWGDTWASMAAMPGKGKTGGKA